MEEAKKEEDKVIEEKSDSNTLPKEVKKEKKKKRDLTIVVGLVVLLVLGHVFMLDGVQERIASFSLSQEKLSTVKELDIENADQFSYVIGSLFATRLSPPLEEIREQGEDVSNEIVLQAIRDVLLEKENTPMTADQAAEYIQLKDEQALGELEQVGEAFMEEYVENEDVIEADNGVLYTVLEEGSGAVVGENAALVSYTGMLIDGTVFDSSPEGETATFTASQVIPGMGELLSSMQVGDSWEMVIPSELAYGEQGIPGVIGPNETLIFTITVEGIEAE